ncbi:MAG: hypothetical protein JO149_05120 [Gammaproteobacteria bacterium]|nr:hypothetical protein [Gammaproteobacteria bacterium]
MQLSRETKKAFTFSAVISLLLGTLFLLGETDKVSATTTSADYTQVTVTPLSQKGLQAGSSYPLSMTMNAMPGNVGSYGGELCEYPFPNGYIGTMMQNTTRYNPVTNYHYVYTTLSWTGATLPNDGMLYNVIIGSPVYDSNCWIQAPQIKWK